jgi:hypothetical protein
MKREAEIQETHQANVSEAQTSSRVSPQNTQSYTLTHVPHTASTPSMVNTNLNAHRHRHAHGLHTAPSSMRTSSLASSLSSSIQEVPYRSLSTHISDPLPVATPVSLGSQRLPILNPMELLALRHLALAGVQTARHKHAHFYTQTHLNQNTRLHKNVLSQAHASLPRVQDASITPAWQALCSLGSRAALGSPPRANAHDIHHRSPHPSAPPSPSKSILRGRYRCGHCGELKLGHRYVHLIGVDTPA